MREEESWTLYVHAKANKFNFKLKAKRFFFPDLYELSFKLKTQPPVSFINKSKSLKSKFIKILEKCRIKPIKNKRNGAKSNSRSQCLGCAGRNSGNLAQFYQWIAAEKDIKGIFIQSLNVDYQLKKFLGGNIIHRCLVILIIVLLSYSILALMRSHFVCNASALGYFFKNMFRKLINY